MKPPKLEPQAEISDQKEECFMPETAKHPAVEDSESDHDPTCQVLEGKNEPKYFEAKPKINTEATTKDSEEKPEAGTHSQKPSLDSVNEKDEKVAKVDIFDKSDLESKLNPAEVNQQVPVKRKRGRPRKYPIEIKIVQDQESEAGTSTGNTMKTSSTSSKQKINPEDREKSHDAFTISQLFLMAIYLAREDKVLADQVEIKQTQMNIQPCSFKLTVQKEAEEEKTEVVLRRRGRKPKRPLIPSEETGMDTPEPEKKRQKLAPAVEEETKDQDGGKDNGSNGRDDDDSGGDADGMHSGAITRLASRLEAQRKQPSKPTTRAASKNQSPDLGPPRKRQRIAGKKQSPAHTKSNKSPISTHSKLQSPKCKREVSSLVSYKKGHQRADEPEVKKSKR
ncbi:hypothetical protein JD844_027320 [Phrynosoma platyrhinos]|uniref:Uncharacterized protein n=1 Tax=Phrynosoma platyrhinos TaxID=52577 RepID=A0ABQ7SG20_PHRPL|nr:hypothetical protein JD844_027320 [Phrynosoma platyrhinos]